MIIDIHCHLGLTALPVDESIPRFSFEARGAAARPGFDSYMSGRMMTHPLWKFIKFKLGIPQRLVVGPEMDAMIEAVNLRHLLGSTGIDRFAVFAFDEYHRDDGTPAGPIPRGADVAGTDLYTSNSFARAWCARHPDRFLFVASVHPYRRGAIEALEEVAAGGAVMIKWLPVHMNIHARDPRVEAFVRRAAELQMPLLVHYGGEGALRSNHVDQTDPRPMLDLLAKLHRRGSIPPTVIAHLATPTLPLQSPRHVYALTDALLGRFRDAPVYADISAQTVKPWWLKWMLRRPALHDKLVFGTDFPIPPGTWGYPLRMLGRRRKVLASPWWPEQTLSIVRMLGFPESVMTRGYEVLRGRMGSELQK